MSSILKALQKLEQDKATRPDRGIDVTKGIVAGGRKFAPRPVWVVPAGMVGVTVLAVLVTYTLMGGFASRESTPKKPVTFSIAAGQPQPAATPSSLPTTLIREENIPAEPLPKVVKRAISRTPVRPTGPPFSIAPSVDVAPPPPVAPSPAASSEPADSTRQEYPQGTTGATRLPIIKVSGIAWQKDSTARLAVVNGISVTEGSMVEGVQVEGISPDRVRFSYKNEKFDVSLGKGTP